MNNDNNFPKKIAIGSDHVGYDLKEDVRAYLAAHPLPATVETFLLAKAA